MRTLEDLRKLYAQDIAPALYPLERERKRILRKFISAAAIVVLSMSALAFFLVPASPNFGVFSLILGAIILAFVYQWLIKDYTSDFKTAVIQKIVTFIDPGLAYSKHGKINRSFFSLSGIFRQRLDKYSGDDHVTGAIGKTRIEFSELYTACVERDSRGRRHEKRIFKGLFFMADFNKDFIGKTFVLPDTAERMFGHVGTLFQSMNRFRGELIKLEDVDFERQFAVYGSDQIEARYILSTSLMKRILDFQKKTGKRIYLSFVGSKLFVAIPYGKDLFEPRVFRTILHFDPIKEYFQDLQLAIGIVEDLNLNTRIWTKQGNR